MLHCPGESLHQRERPAVQHCDRQVRSAIMMMTASNTFVSCHPASDDMAWSTWLSTLFVIIRHINHSSSSVLTHEMKAWQHPLINVAKMCCYFYQEMLR